MIATTHFRQINLSVVNAKTYLFSTLFVIGNLVLPQICHLIPDGGKIFLPIYFFTLIASYKFGLKVGLLTAIFSPLMNYLFFGMPMLAMLPVILAKSSLLAVAAAWIGGRSKSVSLLLIALTILAYQVLGGVAEWIITVDFSAALQDFRLGYPGMLVQWIAGWGLLKLMAKNEF
ncbi:MAG: ECF transporter S component [Bacteroidales bacterium]|nr:ECF transporter S component [Bacteroidales bacterium]